MNATNKEIIANAKESTNMVFCGWTSGTQRYFLETWDENRNAWYQGNQSWDYWQSKMHLHESYIDSIIEQIYGTQYNSFDSHNVHNYADWRQFARIIINHARNNKEGIFSENN